MKLTIDTINRMGPIAITNYADVRAGIKVMRCPICGRTIASDDLGTIEFVDEADLMESFISGTCDACWNKMFPEEE